jgi:hypothetical protein
MSTSVREFFNKRVTEALKRNPNRAKEVQAVFQFRVSGPDGGIWTADLASSPPSCVQGESIPPQCTVEVADQDLGAMIDGGMQVAMQVFLSGKLKLSGDTALLMRLSKILQMGEPSS